MTGKNQQTNQKTVNPTTTVMKPVTAKVQYTNDGFSPKTVTIKKGETVEWTNNANDQMYVASAPHPVHTDYPGFDELQAVNKDGTYTFTFEKTGKWGYHNHLSPSDKGTVIVE